MAALAALLAAMLVGAGLTASPAQAALPSGTGWSGSWNYRGVDTIDVAGTLPGVELIGTASDTFGTRALFGTIMDTANDNRCARVHIYSTSHQAYVVDKQACGAGSGTPFMATNLTGGLLVIIQRVTPGTTTADKGHYLTIPGSADDADLRSAGTGASWSYYAPDAFQYSVVRSGVKLTGYGSHNSLDQRSSLNTVEKTVTSAGCASASVSAGVTKVSGSTCANGGADHFAHFELGGTLVANACYQPTGGTKRCNLLHLPEPW
ncbi:hypothetical protein [Micromonospora sp. KC721]|uniref:hypothetical protein n=1 Tax=Micromonospora sp. KC721 TaxID=2530380 RepID=UPI00104A48BA|nr:hypothetical protein [Micromonospora sp. KC721]TDB74595.1 hypothetical protein E1182_18890 [Micromonospora sp. KC721]